METATGCPKQSIALACIWFVVALAFRTQWWTDTSTLFTRLSGDSYLHRSAETD